MNLQQTFGRNFKLFHCNNIIYGGWNYHLLFKQTITIFKNTIIKKSDYFDFKVLRKRIYSS